MTEEPLRTTLLGRTKKRKDDPILDGLISSGGDTSVTLTQATRLYIFLSLATLSLAAHFSRFPKLKTLVEWQLIRLRPS